jgi:hypothetical protein
MTATITPLRRPLDTTRARGLIKALRAELETLLIDARRDDQRDALRAAWRDVDRAERQVRSVR